MSLSSRFALVDTTLREGEQFAHAYFTSAQRRTLAEALDAFGVEYLELTSPVASPQSARDLEQIAKLGLQARVVTHVRCHLADVRQAVECGAQGVQVLFATSQTLRDASHGRSLEEIIEQAAEVLAYARQFPIEVRFSCEDAFRTPLADLLRVYRAVAAHGVDRVGIADTVGIATPRQVEAVVGAVRSAVACAIEFHGHNDSGCAIANTYAAFEAGASHLDVTVLGIGERNGIASLSGMIARLASLDPQLVAGYRLELLGEIDSLVADWLGMAIPFNNCITSPTAFTHKAGMHSKAVLANPQSYEVLDPARFGRQRTVEFAHRLVGWHAIAERARELGLALSEAQARAATAQIKHLGNAGNLAAGAIDELIYAYAE